MEKEAHVDGHILNIVQNHKIAEQNELQHQLKERGFSIPQATLSRRLKKLNIAKVSGVYQIINYSQTHLPVVLNMQVSDFGMIVLHTHPGNANALAYYLDQTYVSFSAKKNNAPILGSIAGDDTVLLIIKNQKAMKDVIKLIDQDFPYLGVITG